MSNEQPSRLAAVEQRNDKADRKAQPVDAEQSPRLTFPVVGIGASAGGLEAYTSFIKGMRPDAGMAFILIQHLPPDRESMVAEILSRHTKMKVLQVVDGMTVVPDHVYIIRPGYTLRIKDGKLHLGERVEKPAHNRPVDDFFRSLAEEQRERAICIIMSGMGSNGSAGAQAIKAVGGLCIAQDPETAQFPSMPRHLIDAGYADFILRTQDMPDVLMAYAEHPYTRERTNDADDVLRRERHHLREILAVLRTRTRHDFTGYKKPTVLRRVQRRMGLNRVTEIGEYAKILRQSPTEVSALADDLLIHVTGFFRDTEAWEVLRERVIVPLVAAREQDAVVRCWVTACSSGEEAYSLAMLLVEEAERVGKRLDIKVFATDMAERTLQNARTGTYPGGIETEISPQRLERFFLREDAVYRVRPDLRERVVFAPQNVLQDPPFSRLDLVTCRNLLIYLEPDIQHRVLELLHFGLREGGALFLGTSETVAGAEELFEPVDKKSRIYRRIGPTRHGTVQFPLPRVTSSPGGERLRLEARASVRPSLAQLTTRSLIEFHTPAAVTVDRNHRILYFHGDTNPFLGQPRGEATRELIALAKDSVRGAIRVALNHATSTGERMTAPGGWIEISPGRRVRIAVTASPLELKSAHDYFVVSFQERSDTPAESSVPAKGESSELEAELNRIRDELQSTVEELQTSNEELKASNEEVMSVNEELQSSNEELETSREEMQSLNEELTTVNTQLQAKMEELQSTSNDLASLLTSTNIAVLFLDIYFNIRRFTPAVTDLMELIPSDVGRPLSDLARKFVDPSLEIDARTVLEKLIPVEKEIATSSGQWYLRRVLPYRTTDNRIEGVVITFVDITRRKESDQALRESEERFRLLVEGARDFAMFMTDRDGRITTWSASAERLLEWSEGEAIGNSVKIIFTPEDQANGAPQRELAEALQAGKASDERWHVTQNGRRFWGSGVLSTVYTPDGQPRGFVKVLRDETARKRAEDALHQAAIAAETASRMKDEFLATLSHELRTPLSAILLWSSILRRGKSDPEQMAEGLQAIETSAEAQKTLIEDLLDTSRITSGKLRLQMKDVELVTLIQAAVDAVRPGADSKGVVLKVDSDAAAGSVYADPDRLHQILWNLLSNAVKFTPSGGRVDVGLKRYADRVEIDVADTGQGIDPAFLPYAFDRFRQADSSTSRTIGGLGLGLSITKQLVELHGGSVRVESKGLGRGARFTVEIPLRDAKALLNAGAAGSQVASTHGNGSTDVNVLLVEDDADTRYALTVMLEQAGFILTPTASAAAALDAFNTFRPDVIVSDIGMPGEDGYSLMRRLRAHENDLGLEVVPAIAVTAFARDEDRLQALEAGFQHHMGKPIEFDKLVALLRKVGNKA